jgi:hypothetical protein
MYLSELGYSELVQRLFEKMTFFLVDPLLQLHGCGKSVSPTPGSLFGRDWARAVFEGFV